MKSYPHHNRIKISRRILLLCLLCLCCGSSTRPAQALPSAVKLPTVPGTPAQPAPTPQPERPPPVDPLGRSSPHGCVLGFLEAAETKDYEKAAQYLDGKRSPDQATKLVDQLKYLLDQNLSTSLDDISRSPKGDVEDQLRISRESIATVTTPNGDLKIWLDLIKRPGQPAIWLFSQETLHQVPAAYASMQHTDYEQYFPAWTARVHFLSIPLWRWGLILFSLLLALIAASLLARALLWMLQMLLRRRLSVDVKSSVLALRPSISVFVLALMLRIMGAYSITALGRHYWRAAGFILIWISSAWLVISISDILISLVRHRYLLRMQVERATFTSLLGRIFKILVVLILIVALLTYAGVDVSALIAGLGIGGVALALAAQKTLADLFGGLSIIMRGAVRVGDFCQINGITGTVEDIGISALSLRTLDRSVVSIPNSKVAEVGLENFSLRDQFWIHQVFSLRFDTPHNVLKTLLDQFVQILTSHPEVDPSSARARLINLTPSGPEIEVFAYFRRSGADRAVFLAEQEPLLLKMVAAIEASGTTLATPTDVLRRPSSNPSSSSANPR